MSIKRKLLAATATLTILGGLSAAATVPAGAATPACGAPCVSVFSSPLGTVTQPNFVEAVLGGEARVGQLVGLKRASGSDPSEDIMGTLGSVSDFYAQGMVSAEVNLHYGALTAAQLQYAPLGVTTGLCVGVADDAYQNEPLSLQLCSVPGRTVFILGPRNSAGYFPIINASTTDFSRPFAMAYPRHVDTTDETLPPIRLRRLQYQGRDHTLPGTQLWGVYRGIIPTP